MTRVARGCAFFLGLSAVFICVFVPSAAAATGLAFAGFVTIAALLISASVPSGLALDRDQSELTELSLPAAPAPTSAPTAATADHQRHPRRRRLCRLLVTAATWVLPPHHRPRYREEFQAELQDLGSWPRRYRLAYSLRVVSRCWSLRQSVPDPAPKAPARPGMGN